MQHPIVVYVSIFVATITVLWNNREAIGGVFRSIYHAKSDRILDDIKDNGKIFDISREMYEARLGAAVVEMEGLQSLYNETYKELATTQSELLSARVLIVKLQMELNSVREKLKFYEGDKNGA
nr:MAG TPA: hypothetical protein [Caudoviricetes sp.]